MSVKDDVKLCPIERADMLVWFFVDPKLHSRGLGTKAWFAIERSWPGTAVWELGTPYADKHNLVWDAPSHEVRWIEGVGHNSKCDVPEAVNGIIPVLRHLVSSVMHNEFGAPMRETG